MSIEKEIQELQRQIDALKAKQEQSKQVKPLFPKSWEEGARFVEHTDGCIEELIEGDNFPNWVVALSRQGRTFYTHEEAEASAKRERARAYCLERINEVNEGDNGFDKNGQNYVIEIDHLDSGAIECIRHEFCQVVDAPEHIRKRKAAEQLISDPEFVENWKIWKGVE